MLNVHFLPSRQLSIEMQGKVMDECRFLQSLQFGFERKEILVGQHLNGLKYLSFFYQFKLLATFTTILLK